MPSLEPSARNCRAKVGALPPRLSASPLIWLSAVNWADRSRLIVCALLSQHALSVPVVLQVRLVGGIAF